MKAFIRTLVILALLVAAVLVTSSTGQAQSLPRATVACAQFLRSQPDNNAITLATLLPQNEPPLIVTGRTEDGGWLVVLRANGQTGWAADTPCINVQGNKFDTPVMVPVTYNGPPLATIGCTQYLRSAPNTEASRLLILYPSDGVLEVLGRDDSGQWLLVGRADGAQGWVVDTACIVVQGDVSLAPITTPVVTTYSGAPIATIGCTQYLRSGPDNSAAAQVILTPNDGVLQILGRDDSGGWLYVRRADGLEGWVADTPCILTRGATTDAPVAQPVSYSGPPIATIGCTQYLRSGPDNAATPQVILYPSDGVLEVLGQNEAGGWLLVRRADGAQGWVADTPCILVRGNMAQAAVTQVETYSGPPIATIGCTQYLRDAPSNDATRHLILYPSDGVLEIIGRDMFGEWLLVRRADGAQGWAYDTPCINVRGNEFDAPLYINGVLAPTPPLQSAAVALAAASSPGAAFNLPQSAVVTTAAPLPIPMSVDEVPLPNATIGCTQYLRAAPVNSSARLLILYPSDGVLQIAGRDNIAEWLLVRRWDGALGWVVDTPCIVVNGNVFDAPLSLETPAFIPSAPMTSGQVFPVAVAGTPQGAVAQPEEAAPELGPIHANCNAVSGPLLVTPDRWVYIDFPIATNGPEEIAAWYHDSAHRLLVDGQDVPVTFQNEIPAELVNTGTKMYWYGGFRVPIGQLAPGRHEIFWIANLLTEREHLDGNFQPGSTNLTCTLFVQ